jgi:RNA polymerase sigma-70 factor (ECF subfamily)
MKWGWRARKSMAEAIEEALASLNPTFRAVVALRDIEDLSYEEIADILQVPLGTVKSRILRGREALRTELERRLASGQALQLAPQTVE